MPQPQPSQTARKWQPLGKESLGEAFCLYVPSIHFLVEQYLLSDLSNVTFFSQVGKSSSKEMCSSKKENVPNSYFST